MALEIQYIFCHTSSSWYIQGIDLEFSWDTSLTGYADDIFHVISNFDVPISKFYRNFFLKML